MTENEARNALLVRAFETADPRSTAWGEDDAAWASRAAAEVEGERAEADAFIARRAHLAAGRLSVADASAGRALRALAWRPWIGWALAAIAFALGMAGDAIGRQQRINVLAPPLLALLAWNLAVYAGIALRLAMPRRHRPAAPGPVSSPAGTPLDAPGGGPLVGPISRLVARILARRRPDAPSGPLAHFATEWTRASAPLNTARAARVLHAGAIAFALGALAGMYLRGLGLEFRAGWESTFLGASAVRALLEFTLGPASALTGIALPDAARLEAMRLPGSTGEPAGPWIHLYAVTVGLVVILPRLALAALSRLREHRLATRFPLRLDDAYFAALARAHRGEAARVVAIPHMQSPSPQALQALRELLAAALGAGTRLAMLPPVAYGDEETAAAALAQAVAAEPPTLVLALMASTATPEPQAQGAFVDALSSALPAGAALLPLVDESAFVTRFGETTSHAPARREERQAAWTRFLAERGHSALVVDLERAGTQQAVRLLRERLDGLARSPAPARAR